MFLGLNNFFQTWKPSPEEFAAPLAVPQPFRFKLQRLIRGIDNAHIDVVLSPNLADAARRLVRSLVESEANERLGCGWGWAVPPSPQQFEHFRQLYAKVMEASYGEAHRSERRELVQLAEFAVLKFLLVLIAEEMESFRTDLQQQRGHGLRGSARAMQIRDRIAAFSRERPAVHHQVSRRLFGPLRQLETGGLRQLRKSLLGRSWPVPNAMLFNPLLLLSSIWDQGEAMRTYPLIGLNREHLSEFAAVNGVLTSVFAEYLPEWALPPPALPADSMESGSILPKLRLDQGELRGFLEVELVLGRALREEEYLTGRTGWLDDPANLERLLFADRPASVDSYLAGQGEPEPAPLPWGGKPGFRFRVSLIKEAQARCKSLGLLPRIYAEAMVPAVYDDLQGRLPVPLIFDYLAGTASRRDMYRCLDAIRNEAEADAALRRLNSARSAIRSMGLAARRRCVVDFLIRFARLRRDLKLAHLAYRVMDQVRLLRESEHIELSRSNRTLHEFLQGEELSGDRQEIRGHAILKADLRGSSRIIRELKERRLNPASHFSLNFFGPIDGLLDRFGAKKVFVEGDAVILCVYEHVDAPNDWLAVCRAAGLARKILQVVDAQNAQNRKYGLPELELGLGIAWLGEAPAFLYDGDHEIVISSAINRADRLSSCAASLRETSLGRTLPRGVEVLLPVEQGIMQKDSGDRLLRYNVNGIELDPAAFPKLQQELALRKVEARFPQYGPGSVFHVGRYRDRTGYLQPLVVREAPVRRWIGNDISDPDPEGRRFFEIVTDREVWEQLKDKLTSGPRSMSPFDTVFSPNG
jgi:hypothetical protein